MGGSAAASSVPGRAGYSRESRASSAPACRINGVERSLEPGIGCPLTERVSECILTPMAPPTQTQPRTLSTAEERREDVLRAAMKVVGERGLYGTPTTEIARASGISQAYLFRLFPTKTELFVAVIERSYQRVRDTLIAAVAESTRDGRPALQAMGEAYTDLLRDPELLLTQLQGQAAASEPAVREALRRGFQELFELAERESDATP